MFDYFYHISPHVAEWMKELIQVNFNIFLDYWSLWWEVYKYLLEVLGVLWARRLVRTPWSWFLSLGGSHVDLQIPWCIPSHHCHRVLQDHSGSWTCTMTFITPVVEIIIIALSNWRGLQNSFSPGGVFLVCFVLFSFVAGQMDLP